MSYAAPQAVDEDSPAHAFAHANGSPDASIWVAVRRMDVGRPFDPLRSSFAGYSRRHTEQIVGLGSAPSVLLEGPAASWEVVRDGTEAAGFQLWQRRVGEPHRKRHVFVVPIRWEWNQSSDALRPEWRAYDKDSQWVLEEAYATRMSNCTLTIMGETYTVDISGEPMTQYHGPRLFGVRSRAVRRVGLRLHDDVAGALQLVPVAAAAAAASPPRPVRGLICRSFWDDPTLLEQARIIVERAMNSTFAPGHRVRPTAPGAVVVGRVWHPSYPGGWEMPTHFEVVRLEPIANPEAWRRYCAHRMRLADDVEAADAAGYGAVVTASRRAATCADTCAAAQELFAAGLGNAPFDPQCNEILAFHGATLPALDAFRKNTFESRLPPLPAYGESFDAYAELNADSDAVHGYPTHRAGKVTGKTLGAGVYLADVSSKSNQYVPDPIHGCDYFGASGAPPAGYDSTDTVYQMLVARAPLGLVKTETNVTAAGLALYRAPPDTDMFLHNPLATMTPPRHTVFVEGYLQAGGASFTQSYRYREWVIRFGETMFCEFIVHYRRRTGPPPS